MDMSGETTQPLPMGGQCVQQVLVGPDMGGRYGYSVQCGCQHPYRRTQHALPCNCLRTYLSVHRFYNC
jgi:hypothetical protein